MPRRKWNPRYRFYARVNGRTPQGQLDHDAKDGSSGIWKFSMWVREITAEYELTCPLQHSSTLQGKGPGRSWSYRNSSAEGLAKYIKKKYPKIRIAW